MSDIGYSQALLCSESAFIAKTRASSRSSQGYICMEILNKKEFDRALIAYWEYASTASHFARVKIYSKIWYCVMVKYMILNKSHFDVVTEKTIFSNGEISVSEKDWNIVCFNEGNAKAIIGVHDDTEAKGTKYTAIDNVPGKFSRVNIKQRITNDKFVDDKFIDDEFIIGKTKTGGA